MARSITYWYDKIIVEKNTMSSLSTLQPNIDNSQLLLNDITSNSRVARWRFWVWSVAALAYSLDVIFDLSLITFESLSKKSRFGTLPWYNSQALLFQYGDTLVYQNNEYQYPTINGTNQIIKRSASEENGNIVNLKVAKLVSNIPTKLNSTEKTAFDAYILKIKPAGVTVNVISDDPDNVRLYLTVNYDPLLLDNTGQLLSSTGIYPVKDAIDNYLINLNLSFNGTLELCDLIDAIQQATGCKSAYIISASARYGSNPFTVFSERYISNAGHIIIDPINPLSTTINYQSINV